VIIMRPWPQRVLEAALKVYSTPYLDRLLCLAEIECNVKVSLSLMVERMKGRGASKDTLRRGAS
jgi:hypothetical protein